MISEKAKGAYRLFPVHSNRQMHRRHHISIGSLPGCIGEAKDKPQLNLAFVIVKESLVVPAIYC
jgi:hypothetical protein